MQRVSRQRLPPSVPMFRRCGVATEPAALASAAYPARTFSCSAISVSVSPVPSVRPLPFEIFFNSDTFRMPITIAGVC